MPQQTLCINNLENIILEDESKGRRHLYPELLFGFSLLSVANILNKNEQEQTSENKTDDIKTESKSDRSQFSLLQK